MFHAVLPLVGYAALAVAAFTARSHENDALFATEAVVLVPLFSGIHNAWDAVTYHVFSHRQEHASVEDNANDWPVLLRSASTASVDGNRSAVDQFPGVAAKENDHFGDFFRLRPF